MRWWPLPALLTWLLAWLVFAGLHQLAAPTGLALTLAALIGVVSSLWGNTRWRRILLAAGFPVSMALTNYLQMNATQIAQSGPAHAALNLSAVAWLFPLALLLLLYPMRSWRDAPMFPTPRGALRGLSSKLPENTRHILDAGCGLGDGLRELHREFPKAQLSGVEWSWPLRWACAWRAPFAQVKRADMWAADWSGFDFVYLFQRPESLPRALEKASAEMRHGAWLGSLEFEAAAWVPQAVHQCADGRRLWLYQLPFRTR